MFGEHPDLIVFDPWVHLCLLFEHLVAETCGTNRYQDYTIFGQFVRGLFGHHPANGSPLLAPLDNRHLSPPQWTSDPFFDHTQPLVHTQAHIWAICSSRFWPEPWASSWTFNFVKRESSFYVLVAQDWTPRGHPECEFINMLVRFELSWVHPNRH